MSDFLNNLYKEEQKLYKSINPMFMQLLTIQNLITLKGGAPKCKLEEKLSKRIYTFTIESKMNK